jgi:hypothetical protein
LMEDHLIEQRLPQLCFDNRASLASLNSNA